MASIALTKPETRPVRRVRRGDPPPVDLAQPDVGPQRGTGEPPEDHSAGIPVHLAGDLAMERPHPEAIARRSRRSWTRLTT
jgi:hypothetical protein